MEEFAVIGLGQFGHQVAVSLAQAGHEVLAIDTDMARIEEIKDLVVRAVRADASREDVMRALGVDQVDTAIIGLGEENFEAAVLAVALLRQLGVPHIIARSSTRERGRILGHVGAEQVIYPEVEVAERLARRLAAPGLMEEACLPSGHTLAEIRLPASLVGRTLADARLRAGYGLNVVAVRRGEDPGASRSLEPSAAMKLEPGDVLVVVGQQERVAAFAQLT